MTKIRFFDFSDAYWPLQGLLFLAVVAPSAVLAIYSYHSAEQQFSTQAFLVYCSVFGSNLMLTFGIIHSARMVKKAYRFEKTLLENIGEGIVATDEQGRLIRMNPQAEHMLGWTLPEAYGKMYTEVLPMLDEKGVPVPLTFRPMYYALKVGKKTTTTTTPTFYYVVRRDKSKFPTAITVAPLLERNKVIGAIEVFRDISSEKDVDRAKSEFVSLAAHQLLTPISAVKVYAYLFHDGDLGRLAKKQKEAAGTMILLIDRMVSLIESLLNVSRIELGTFSVESQPTNFGAVAEGVILELQSQIDEKRIIFVKKFDPKMPMVNADPNLLTIIFQNLLSNAVRYSPEGGMITFSIDARPAVVVISVVDQGIGIPRDEQPKIFTKFFRANNARQKIADGNGLGLYMVKSILEHTGGRIWFTSEEHNGTTFLVTIPIEGMKPREGIHHIDAKA